MKVLFIGDIFGRPGRNVLKDTLPGLIDKFAPTFVVANVENAAGGRGVNKKTAQEIFSSAVDAGTGGNHVWEQDDAKELVEKFPIVRPLNTEGDFPGSGYSILEKGDDKLCVVSIQGTVFMDGKGPKMSNPFHAMEKLLSGTELPKCVLVDFHAEATSEKRAMLWYLNGRVSALLGTHTHVQTADEEVTEEGTAYITDVGMTGPHKSVIGVKKEAALERFLKGNNKSLTAAKEGVRLEAVLVEIDDASGRAESIMSLQVGAEK